MGKRWNAQMGCEEKWCNQCQAWWPATDEFFYQQKHYGFTGPCKACIAEKREATNAVTPCCVEGCDQPRHNRRVSRCTPHYQALQHEQYLKRKLRRGLISPPPSPSP